jgi:hypothetical protein
VIPAVGGPRCQRQWRSQLRCNGRHRLRRLANIRHRHKRKEANQSILRLTHRGIRRLTGFRLILPWLALGPRTVEPPTDLTRTYRSTQWRIPNQQPSAPEHFSGAEGCLFRAAGAEGYPFFGTPRVAHEGLLSASACAASASSSSSSLPSKGQGADARCRPGLQHSPWQ